MENKFAEKIVLKKNFFVKFAVCFLHCQVYKNGFLTKKKLHLPGYLFINTQFFKIIPQAIMKKKVCRKLKKIKNDRTFSTLGEISHVYIGCSPCRQHKYDTFNPTHTNTMLLIFEQKYVPMICFIPKDV